MNVLLISGDDHSYGTAVITKHMIERYNKADLKLTVVTCKCGSINELCNAHNIRNFSLPFKYFVADPNRNSLYKLLKLVYCVFFDIISMIILMMKFDIGSIDIIHTNHQSIYFGCTLSRVFKIKHLMSIRAFKIKDFLFKNQISLMNSNVDIFLSVSKSVCKFWNDLGVDDKKNFVLYDGIDFEKYHYAIRNFDKKSKIKAIMLARYDKNKGQLIAIKAIEYLLNKYNLNIVLDLYGVCNDTNDYLNHIRKYILEKKICKNISVNDYIFNKDLLLEYDLGLICSEYEGFGLSTIEYSYMGLNVIASDRPASNEIIENNINGLLFKYDDYIDLAEKIYSLYNDRMLMNNLSRNAHNNASEKFDISYTINGYVNNYLQLK